MNFSSNFRDVSAFIEKNARTFCFNTKSLPPINDFKTDIVGHPQFSDLFILLNGISSNAVYWFETNSIDNTQILVEHFSKVRPTLHKTRTVPPLNQNRESSVLYVGKRQGGSKKDGWKHIAGRMIHHLGYYSVGSTQGLQLAHWASDLDVNITFKVYSFDNLSNQDLKAMENIMSGRLHPLLGRH